MPSERFRWCHVSFKEPTRAFQFDDVTVYWVFREINYYYLTLTTWRVSLLHTFLKKKNNNKNKIRKVFFIPRPPYSYSSADLRLKYS